MLRRHEIAFTSSECWKAWKLAMRLKPTYRQDGEKNSASLLPISFANAELDQNRRDALSRTFHRTERTELHSPKGKTSARADASSEIRVIDLNVIMILPMIVQQKWQQWRTEKIELRKQRWTKNIKYDDGFMSGKADQHHDPVQSHGSTQSAESIKKSKLMESDGIRAFLILTPAIHLNNSRIGTCAQLARQLVKSSRWTQTPIRH